MQIDGMTEKMIDSLCRKWKYPETVEVVKDVRVPDPNPEAKKGATIVKKQKVDVPNPQPKEEFVKAYVIEFIKNEYRLQEREDDKKAAEKATDARIEKEVVLK